MRYADSNPVEGVRLFLRPGPTADIACADPDHLTRTLRRGLAHVQRHPELNCGRLTETGLALDPGKRS